MKPLDQWKELPACVKGLEEILQLFLPVLKDFIFRQKRTKKVFLSIRENINLYLSKKEKRGRTIYFGTRSTKKRVHRRYIV